MRGEVAYAWTPIGIRTFSPDAEVPVTKRGVSAS
jgi:hypothetical protein